MVARCTVPMLSVCRAEIVAAAKAALVHDFVTTLEHGYNSLVGERGVMLSGGQKQRVAIARALAMEPRGLLCDEITSALDPELKGEVLAVLEDLKRDRLTIVLVTHEIGFARHVGSRMIFMDGGKIIEDRPPKEMIAEPANPRTKQFLSSILQH